MPAQHTFAVDPAMPEISAGHLREATFGWRFRLGRLTRRGRRDHACHFQGQTMCEPMTILATAAAVGAGASIYQGEQQKKAQQQAQATTEANAKTTAKAAEQATNKANAKAPDTAALNAANVLAANGGQGSTMLTGASGIATDQLSLGKTTLLGS